MRTPALLLALACALSRPALAAQAAPSVPDDVAFQHKSALNGGAVVISLPNDGQYVYRADGTSPASPPAFMLGRPQRQDFKFLSQAEQAALWKYREDQRAAQVAAKREAEARAASLAAAARAQALQVEHAAAAVPARQARINWPRVIVRGDETCVPVLSFSDAADWREHLTCTTGAASNGQ